MRGMLSVNPALPDDRQKEAPHGSDEYPGTGRRVGTLTISPLLTGENASRSR